MRLGRVVGTATGTVKDPGLSGLKLLVVDLVDGEGTVTERHRVVADSVGAGLGDLVLVTHGSAARQAATTRGIPVDATIVAIVDDVTVAKD